MSSVVWLWCGDSYPLFLLNIVIYIYYGNFQKKVKWIEISSLMDHRAEKRRSFHRNTGDVKKKDRIASSMDHRAGKRRKLHRNTFLPYFVLKRPPTLGLIHLLQLHQVF